MIMNKLNIEEKEILDAYESGKMKSVRGKSAELKKHQTYAEATFRKDKRVNIRISSRDLNLLQRRALSEGIPYQTLIASVLHKYVGGQLKDA
jgi:predicted DNA binding CopG/RHH family protein